MNSNGDGIFVDIPYNDGDGTLTVIKRYNGGIEFRGACSKGSYVQTFTPERWDEIVKWLSPASSVNRER